MHEVIWRAVRDQARVQLHLVVDGDTLTLCGLPSLERVDTRTLLGPATVKCVDCAAIATAAAAMAQEVPTHA